MKPKDYPATLYSSDKIRLRVADDLHQIFDAIRKKWLVLTPEEWVRQHLLQYIIGELGYSPSGVSVEKVVSLNGMPKRFDALVYVNALPAILIECKAPHIPLTEEVFHQACRYNTEIGAPITVLSNGLKTVTAQVNLESGEVHFIEKIPSRSSWNER